MHLAERFSVGPTCVEAYVVGEHGASSVFIWSSARIGGMRVAEALAKREGGFDAFRRDVERDARCANITIIEGIGASKYGVGMVAARVAEAVPRDERAVFPVGSFNSRYQVALSLPSVVGRQGVVETCLRCPTTRRARWGGARKPCAARFENTCTRAEPKRRRRLSRRSFHLALIELRPSSAFSGVFSNPAGNGNHPCRRSVHAGNHESHLIGGANVTRLEKDIRESRGGVRSFCRARRCGRQPGASERPAGRQIGAAR